MVMDGALWSTRFRNQLSGVPNRTTAATCGGDRRRHRAGDTGRQGESGGNGNRWWCSRLARRPASNRRARSWWSGSSPRSSGSCCWRRRFRRRFARSSTMRVVHRIHVDRFAWQAGVERVDERLPGRADSRCLIRAAGEYHFDGRTRVVGGIRRRGRGCKRSRRGARPRRARAKIVDSAARAVNVPILTTRGVTVLMIWLLFLVPIHRHFNV